MVDNVDADIGTQSIIPWSHTSTTVLMRHWATGWPFSRAIIEAVSLRPWGYLGIGGWGSHVWKEKKSQEEWRLFPCLLPLSLKQQQQAKLGTEATASVVRLSSPWGEWLRSSGFQLLRLIIVTVAAWCAVCRNRLIRIIENDDDEDAF